MSADEVSNSPDCAATGTGNNIVKMGSSIAVNCKWSTDDSHVGNLCAEVYTHMGSMGEPVEKVGVRVTTCGARNIIDPEHECMTEVINYCTHFDTMIATSPIFLFAVDTLLLIACEASLPGCLAEEPTFKGTDTNKHPQIELPRRNLWLKRLLDPQVVILLVIKR